MIFSEIYGSYFNAVAEMLSLACKGELDNNKIYEITQSKGFAESALNIPSAVKNEWGLLTADNKTPILSAPKMPITTLQKRWLKALLQDKRIKLFKVDDEYLEDVEPLFTPNMFVYYDRYLDGDDFENRVYIKNFQTILKAIHTGSALCIHYETRSGETKRIHTVPYKLEYSAKDDKFRLLSINRSSNEIATFNLGKILFCSIIDGVCKSETPNNPTIQCEIIITNERNALERVMLAFSHLQKESRQIDDLHYRLKLYYNKYDETEILIRLLSFGPRVMVISPESLLNEIKNRINSQRYN